MRVIRSLALLLAALALCGCFEDPVQQRLELRFRADGAVELEARVRIRAGDDFTDDQAVRERTEERRLELAADGLGWPRRVEGLEPERRRFASEYSGDLLEERSFRALVSDPERLEKLLPDGLVRVLLQRSDAGVNELVLLIEPGSRANRRQRDLVARREQRVAEAYLDYLEASEVLVVLLDDRPHRQEIILHHVLEDIEDVFGSRGDEPVLLEDEEPIVERVTDAMNEVLEAFTEVPEGEQRTINELSRLVHDPFAFDFVVRLPTEALESEGFATTGSSLVLRAPRRSLVEAIEELSSRWLEPDWLVELWTGPWRDESVDLDIAELAARPRRADPPASVTELRAALDEALQPPSLLRVRWRSLPPPDPGPIDWESEPQR